MLRTALSHQYACTSSPSTSASTHTIGQRCCSLRPLLRGRPYLLSGRAQEKDGDSSVEDLFAKELRRRGLSLDEGDGGADAKAASSASAELKAQPAQPRAPPPTPPPKSPFDMGSKPPAGTAPRSRAPPPVSYIPAAAEETGGQREKSIALVNEGLEGLIPRASELLKLGTSFFLAFVPLVLGVGLLFGAVYAVFGDSFVHGGTPGMGPPPYIDPERLLSEQTVDGYIPYR